MASQDGKPKTKRLNLFFLNGKLHKRLRIVRAEDSIETWCYPDKRRVAYTYSDVKKNMEYAYSTAQVAEMLGKSVETVKNAVYSGGIEEPAIMYTLTQTKHKHAWRWNEKMIMDLHTYMLSVHRGRPRKDGRITPQKLPTARELRAMIRQEQILYIRNPDGTFVPTWKAEDFT